MTTQETDAIRELKDTVDGLAESFDGFKEQILQKYADTAVAIARLEEQMKAIREMRAENHDEAREDKRETGTRLWDIAQKVATLGATAGFLMLIAQKFIP